MPLPELTELLSKLHAEHLPGQHLYRGQVKRYPPHQIRTEDGVQEIEALYPADFRFFYSQPGVPAEQAEEISKRVTAARAYGRDIRDRFANLLVGHLRLQAEPSQWAKDQLAEIQGLLGRHDVMWPDTNYFRMAWSLAQHYLVGTALTDVTFDLQVASWFATNEWDPDRPAPADGEVGVIYRIDRSLLEQVLDAGTLMGLAIAAQANRVPPPDLFVVDIRGIPSEFARRPRSQHGASIYGFDQPQVVAFAMQKGAIHAFEFVHRAGVDIGITREDVVPSDDLFPAVLEKFIVAQSSLSPKATSPGPKSSAFDCLDRASTVLGLGVRSARHAATHQVSDGVVAYVFDDIERLGVMRIRFSYLMVVEHKNSKAIECAISAEPMELSATLKALPASVLAATGFGTDALRRWSIGGTAPVGMGQFTTIEAFATRALEIAGPGATPQGGPHDVS